MTKKDLLVWATCPYCEATLQYAVPYGYSVVRCDDERGPGCNTPYVILAWQPPPECETSRIEGMPPQDEEQDLDVDAQKMAEQSHDDGERTGPPPTLPPLFTDIGHYTGENKR